MFDLMLLLKVEGELQFCVKTASIWQFIGWILFVFKIVIPVLLILFGMIDLGKAVVANDDKAIKTQTGVLIKRAIAAIIIFFLPTLIAAIFLLVDQFRGGVEREYDLCAKCITNPRSCSTEDDEGQKYVTD